MDYTVLKLDRLKQILEKILLSICAKELTTSEQKGLLMKIWWCTVRLICRIEAFHIRYPLHDRITNSDQSQQRMLTPQRHVITTLIWDVAMFVILCSYEICKIDRSLLSLLSHCKRMTQDSRFTGRPACELSNCVLLWVFFSRVNLLFSVCTTQPGIYEYLSFRFKSHIYI